VIDKELLDILACPKCKGDVEEKDDKIVCLQCHQSYEIDEGIPIMLVDDFDDNNKL